MLVLSRKLNEAIIINGTIRVTVVGIRHNQIRLGFEAPDQVRIYREELCEPTTSPAQRPELPAPVSPTYQPVNPSP